ncbi:MAG: ATP-binding protein [Rikenellaceae bacterium]|nr:ATP-binding protein [Rikenellaceae bacterium]
MTIYLQQLKISINNSIGYLIHGKEDTLSGSYYPQVEIGSFILSGRWEYLTFFLAMLPHVEPGALDIFFMINPDTGKPYTEFGGWQGVNHKGFLPTGQTALFVVSGGKPDDEEARREVLRLLGPDHWFARENILRCEGQGEGEPFLSGRLVLSDEVISEVVFGREYEPSYNASFPARRVATPLGWDDLILPYELQEELEDISLWMCRQEEIKARWELGRLVKPGYRCLFYGLPGTGKTLTAMLLGKRNGLDVYRVDLSMISSKYIGETEKNLAKVFDRAACHNWILFFDEADSLFGRRTETANSNDRHANQEVAYLLQKIEDHPGTVILATNIVGNIDDAFFRRFQSSLCFPMPDEGQRLRLWDSMLPEEWARGGRREELLRYAAGFELSGGSILNVIRSSAVKMFATDSETLGADLLRDAISKELRKEGKLTAH